METYQPTLTKKGYYVVNYRDPETGKPKQKHCGKGPKGYKAAIEFHKGLKTRDYNAKALDVGPVYTDLFNEYIAEKVLRSAPTTIANQDLKFKNVIKPILGDVPVIRFNHKTMETYIRERAKKVKMTTICREYDDINAVFNWSVKKGFIPKNPLDGFEKPKRDDAIIQPVTMDEFKRIMAEIKAEHVRRAVLLAANCGARTGESELNSLKWENVDFDGNQLFIIAAKKGGPEKRFVQLKPAFVELLKQWREADRQDGIKTDYIINYRGDRVRVWRKAWDRAKENAGINRRLRPYDMRHLFATAILENGGDLKSVSEMLGHSRVDTTLKVYQHTSKALHRQTVEKLPDFGFPLQKSNGKIIDISTRKNSEKKRLARSQR